MAVVFVFTSNHTWLNNVRPDLAHDNLEMVRVELLLPHSKPKLVCVCYRPEKVYKFCNIFEEFCVDKECFTNVETIVMGDFNCDFMGKCNSSLYKSFKELLNRPYL